jgi:hypothetical protein
MGQAIAREHPAVVLRSHFNQLRALLAVAMVAVAGLTVAVVILATDGDQVNSTSTARPIESVNYRDFNPTRPDWLLPKWTPNRALSDSQPNVVTGSRYDGGPEEGTADVTPAQPRVIQRQGSPAVVNQSSEATGDYAHGPLPPAAPTKDYSKNGATGDYSTEPQANSGSRADGASDEGVNLRAP